MKKTKTLLDAERIHLLHSWVEVYNDDAKEFIDEIESICNKYAVGGRYSFVFKGEDL